MNIIEPLEGREISWCKSEELNIEDIGDRIATLTEVGNEIKFKFIAKAGCPFSGYVSFFKIKFGAEEDGTSDEDSSTYVFVPARCVDINKPYEILKDKGITENSVLFKVDDEKPLALSYQWESLSEGWVAVSINGDIVSRTAEDLILEATAPDWQPQFVDIALLQLKSISYLTDRLATIDSWFDIKDVLTTTSYSGYQNVLGKIRFDTRLATADDIYQPLTLKDVGILAQIQDWLLKRVVLGVAGTIDISHDPYDPMDNYTLAELQNILKTDLALSKSLINFNFTQLTGYDSLSGESWYEDFDKLVKMWKGELQDNDAFLVGLQQNLRKSNIDFLLDKADTQRLNLLGIYNWYYEVLQVVKGDAYAKLLKDVIDAPDQADSYLETLVNMLNFESDEMGINGLLDWLCSLLSNSPIIECSN